MQSKFRRIGAAFAIAAGIIAGAATFSGNILSFIHNSSNIFNILHSDKKKIPFILKSNVRSFLVLGTVSGTAYLRRPFLKVKFDTAVLHGTKKTHIKSIKVGLAHFINSHGAWDVAVWGEQRNLDVELEKNDSIEIKPFSVAIPIENIRDLKNYWLILWIEISSKRYGVVVTWAQSSTDIFKDL